VRGLHHDAAEEERRHGQHRIAAREGVVRIMMARRTSRSAARASHNQRLAHAQHSCADRGPGHLPTTQLLGGRDPCCGASPLKDASARSRAAVACKLPTPPAPSLLGAACLPGLPATTISRRRRCAIAELTRLNMSVVVGVAGGARRAAMRCVFDAVGRPLPSPALEVRTLPRAAPALISCREN
jgi:hypothetical protein